MSFVYLRDWEDENGDVVEREVYCGGFCYQSSFLELPTGVLRLNAGLTITEGGAWPGYEVERTEYCSHCGEVAATGTDEEEVS